MKDLERLRFICRFAVTVSHRVCERSTTKNSKRTLLITAPCCAQCSSRYLLPTAKPAAVAHAGTDRQTDTVPFYRPCSTFATNWRPRYRKKVHELFTLCVNCITFVIFTKHFTLYLGSLGGGASLIYSHTQKQASD